MMRRGLILLLALALVGVDAVPAQAAPGTGPWRPAAPATQRSVAGHTATPRTARPAGSTVPAWQPKATAWPAAGTVAIPASGQGVAVAATPAARAVTARPGGLPVTLAVGAAGTAPVAMRVFDQGTSARAGVTGVLLQASAVPAGRLTVDYGAFRDAVGGDWAARLRLIRLPDCSVSTPGAAGCTAATPVPSTNDTGTHQVTAETGTGGGVFALAASTSGGTGDYAATSLSPSATWQVGQQSGDFDWSYQMRTVDVPGGDGPGVTVAYSSQSVDGRTASTNNQASWVGEGFNLVSGYIERSYKACSDDGGPSSNGDQCWAGDNATLVLGGTSTELVRDDASGTWRLKDDDDSRVEKLTGATNGAHDGEYWRVTTTDGTQYTFGLNQLPGWSSGKPVTSSTWTVPVYGNDSGEPCYSSSGFASSSCQQAWRWNLDYVVDPHGNVTTYGYAAETNYYRKGYNTATGSSGTMTQYTRDGYLKEIDYGLRTGGVFGNPMAKVVFGVAERCLSTSSFDCATAGNFTKANASHWPDVPFDENCASGDACTTNIAPSFWTRKRLTSVTTQVLTGGSYSTVDTWTLAQSFPAPGDGTAPTLWLDSITHKGNVGGTLSLPPVVFGKTQLANRVDTVGDHLAQFDKFRVGTIDTESGEHLTVTYSTPDCTAADKPTPQSNARRCYPVYWAGDPPQSKPFLDWFHKYVVTQVVETDLTGGAPDKVTTYDYGRGTPAWHFDDGDGLVKDKYKTWGQWRGYDRVSVIGGAAGQTQSEEDYLYYRGMDGDRSDPSDASKTKSVTLTDSAGTTVTDADPLQGQTRQETTVDGPGGAVVSQTFTTPWYRQTAKRVKPWGTTTANLTGTGSSVHRSALGSGGWRTTEVDTTYDGNGLATQVNDLGDTAVGTDDTCTRTTYAQNTAAWQLDHPDRVETVAVACTATPNRPTDVISDTRSYYDGQAFGAAPTHGDITKTDEVASYANGGPLYATTATTQYDAYGRTTQATDALGRKTTTGYTPATGGVATGVTVTDNLGYATTTDLSVAWASPLATVDANNARTDLVYDPLGRLTQVWLPGRSRATYPDTPSVGYAYQLSGGTAPAAVTTKKLVSSGGYAVGVQLYDGLLRPRQTQAQAPGGGRVVSETFYDSRGLVARSNDDYYNGDSGPTATLFTPKDAVPGQNATVFDGLNRPIVETFSEDGNARWQTVTSYGGDRVSVTPPAGGIATTTVFDADGRTTQLLQYHGGQPSGAADTTTYTYTPAGQQATVTDAAGNTWRYGYDLRGRKVESDDPDTGRTTYAYDDADQLLSITDARGVTLAYGYDGLGRRITESSGGTTLARWDYDTVAKGQLTDSVRYVNGLAYTEAVTGYDVQNHPTGTTVTIPADPTAPAARQALAGTYTSYASFNTSTDGTPHSVTYPAAGGLAGETVAFTYDEVGNPTQLTGLAGYVSGVTYGKTGLPLQRGMSDGNGNLVVRTDTYEDGTDRLLRTVDQRTAAPNNVNDTHYAYDDAGTVTSVSNAQSDGQTDTQCFQYDYLRRLTEAWTPTGDCSAPPSPAALGGPVPYWQSYTYDVTGNRTSETDHGTNVTHTYGYPAAGAAQPHTVRTVASGRSTDSYGYDAAGDTTSRTVAGVGQTLTWDAEGNLATVTQNGTTSAYLYDAGGNQLIATDPTGATLYLAGTEVHASTTGAKTATRYYAFAGETVAARTNTGLSWLLTDRQNTGETEVSADATQTVTRRYYTPFGSSRGAVPANWPGQRGFVGGTVNAGTGLETLGARQYDPATGRFLSRDDVFDPDEPQQMNGYSYAGGDPVTYSDPTGLTRCDVGACPTPWQNTHGPNFCETHNCHNSGSPYNGHPWEDPDVNPYSGGHGAYNRHAYNEYQRFLNRYRWFAALAEHEVVLERQRREAQARAEAAARQRALQRTRNHCNGFWGCAWHYTKSVAKVAWDNRTAILAAASFIPVVGVGFGVLATISAAYDAYNDFKDGHYVSGSLDVAGVLVGGSSGGLSGLSKLAELRGLSILSKVPAGAAAAKLGVVGRRVAAFRLGRADTWDRYSTFLGHKANTLTSVGGAASLYWSSSAAGAFRGWSGQNWL